MIWFFVLFGACFIAVALIVARKAPVNDIDDFVVAGRRLPFGVISASVLVSWLWTTSLLGAAEAGYLFGIGGGFAFAFGSAVPFFIFIPLALRLRKVMPHGTTFLEFIKQRYGTVTHHILVGLMLLMALYICAEQIIGIAYAVSGSFGVSYPVVAIFATVLVVGYIAIAGLRGAIINDVIQFVVISLVALILIPIVFINFGVDNLHSGLLAAASNPDAAAYNPDALTFFSGAAVRYFAVALVVSFGFVLLNQGYYSKARASSSSKSLLWAYIVGTIVAWLPIPILFGGILGGVGIAEGLAEGNEMSVTTEVAGYVIVQNFGSIGALLFSLVIFMAGLTTAGNTLAGFQANWAVDVEDGMFPKQRSSKVKKRNAQVATLVFGVIVCVAAVLLEGASLLQIDIVSGIIFSTPMAAIVAAMWWKKTTRGVAITSIVVGLIGGIATYFAVPDSDLDYFYGNVVALLLPVAVVAIGSIANRRSYDFTQLLEYRSLHHTESMAQER